MGWNGRRCAPASPREAKPLRAFGARPRSRAQVVYRFVAGLGERYGVEVRASYDRRRNPWWIGWDPLAEDADRIEAVVHAALAEDPAIAPFAAMINMGAAPASGGRWAVR
jgi:hypothetical protein